VRLVLTASKIKLFSDAERNIDEAMRLVTNLTEKICVQVIEKFGQLLAQSRIYLKKLGHVKIMEWKKQYYFYFDKTQIKIDEARRLIEEVTGVEHYGIYLIKRHREER